MSSPHLAQVHLYQSCVQKGKKTARLKSFNLLIDDKYFSYFPSWPILDHKCRCNVFRAFLFLIPIALYISEYWAAIFSLCVPSALSRV